MVKAFVGECSVKDVLGICFYKVILTLSLEESGAKNRNS
jgi:hypothetical protein